MQAALSIMRVPKREEGSAVAFFSYPAKPS